MPEKRERCPEHHVSLPCPGCRADRLVAGTEPPQRLPEDYTDAKTLAAGGGCEDR